MRAVAGEAALSFVGVESGVGLCERKRNLALAQEPQVFFSAACDKRHGLCARVVGGGAGEAHVLTVLGTGGNAVAIGRAREPRTNRGVGRLELLVDHLALRGRGILRYRVHHGTHRVEGRCRALRLIGGIGGRGSWAVAAGGDRDPASGVALVGRGSMHAQHIAGLVAARRDASDALRPGAERGNQARHTGPVPGAEIEFALDLELRVVIDGTPRFSRGRLAVGLRAAPLEARERQRAGRQRLGEALVQAGVQRFAVGAAAAAGEREEEQGGQSAHGQPPMKGSERSTVSTNAFMRSMKKAPASGTIRWLVGAGPYFAVSACMLAIAVAVEPMLKPMKAAEVTAAS